MRHSYSRGKFKFNPARSDTMIIHANTLINQVYRDLNTFAMRVKIWYNYHFSELRIIVEENYMLANCTALIHDKRSFFTLIVSYNDNQEM